MEQCHRGSSRRNAGMPRPSFHDLPRLFARSRVLNDAKRQTVDNRDDRDTVAMESVS